MFRAFLRELVVSSPREFSNGSKVIQSSVGMVFRLQCRKPPASPLEAATLPYEKIELLFTQRAGYEKDPNACTLPIRSQHCVPGGTMRQGRGRPAGLQALAPGGNRAGGTPSSLRSTSSASTSDSCPATSTTSRSGGARSSSAATSGACDLSTLPGSPPSAPTNSEPLAGSTTSSCSTPISTFSATHSGWA